MVKLKAIRRRSVMNCGCRCASGREARLCCCFLSSAPGMGKQSGGRSRDIYRFLSGLDVLYVACDVQLGCALHDILYQLYLSLTSSDIFALHLLHNFFVCSGGGRIRKRNSESKRLTLVGWNTSLVNVTIKPLKTRKNWTNMNLFLLR